MLMHRVSVLLLMIALASASYAAPVFLASYSQSASFTDALGTTTMTVAFDGTNYWSASGGSAGGVRYAQYDAAGSLVGTFSPGLDFRSVFTDGSGNVYARQYANSTIYQQTAPGTFTSFLTLNGGSLDAQSAVVLDSLGGGYIAMQGGTVSRWDGSGNTLGGLTLVGYGAGGESSYPQNRGIASAGGYYLTYDGAGVLSAWDPATGIRVDQTTLIGAGTGFDSAFSLSYANGMVWIVDAAQGTWRGYDVDLGGVQSAIPEPGSLSLLAGGLGLLLAARLRKRKLAR